MDLSRIEDRPLARLRASLTRYGRRRFAPSLTSPSTRTIGSQAIKAALSISPARVLCRRTRRARTSPAREQTANMPDKMTIAALQEMKRDGNKSIGVVAWDYQIARIADRAGVDFISVGDSVGVNLWGRDEVLEVTLDE